MRRVLLGIGFVPNAQDEDEDNGDGGECGN
jgi:hypothetical protein